MTTVVNGPHALLLYRPHTSKELGNGLARAQPPHHRARVERLAVCGDRDGLHLHAHVSAVKLPAERPARRPLRPSDVHL